MAAHLDSILLWLFNVAENELGLSRFPFLPGRPIFSERKFYYMFSDYSSFVSESRSQTSWFWNSPGKEIGSNFIQLITFFEKIGHFGGSGLQGGGHFGWPTSHNAVMLCWNLSEVSDNIPKIGPWPTLSLVIEPTERRCRMWVCSCHVAHKMMYA